jgi:hypothetical protein
MLIVRVTAIIATAIGDRRQVHSIIVNEAKGTAVDQHVPVLQVAMSYSIASKIMDKLPKPSRRS